MSCKFKSCLWHQGSGGREFKSRISDQPAFWLYCSPLDPVELIKAADIRRRDVCLQKDKWLKYDNFRLSQCKASNVDVCGSLGPQGFLNLRHLYGWVAQRQSTRLLSAVSRYRNSP